ncbi:unannotated protein [freshwater metagenome]|uniref:Unannotated protein n=1 Tax=freshwater metagenome TaxID=449393 RepID=A0A6J7H9V4_9ZZZZ|nr:hypothetical protein [Actinomycetota bacterium]
MRKVSFITSLFLIASLISLPQANAANAKSGGACKELNAVSVVKGLQYTCKKSGAKLIWSKGKKVSPAVFKAPIPISLPVAQTGAITFDNVLDHIPEIPQTAWQKVQDVIAANSSISTSPKTKFDVRVGPNTQINVTGGLPRIQEVLLRSEKLWSGFSQSKTFYLSMYNGQDEEWAENDWKAIATSKRYLPSGVQNITRRIADMCEREKSAGGASGKIKNCEFSEPNAISNSDDAIALFGQSTQGASFAIAATSGGRLAGLHAHSVQDSQWIGNPKNYCNDQTSSPTCYRTVVVNSFAPCWLIQGQLNSIGFMTAAQSYDSYSALRATLPFNQGATTVTDYSRSSLRDYLYKQTPLSCQENPAIFFLSFGVGALATEVLTAIAGPQATMAVFALGAQGQDFPTAFKNVYGISWSDASTILSKVLAAEYATYGPPPF